MVSCCKLVALLRSKPNQSANLRSSGSSDKILSTDPIRRLVKSYSSKIGMGADPSRKTRGRMVIFVGSDRDFRHELRIENGSKYKKCLLVKWLDVLSSEFKIFIIGLDD